MRVEYIFFLLLLLSCRNETVNHEPFTPRLYKITTDGKTVYTFDYDEKGRLIYETQYFNCETEFRKISYSYSDGKLVSRNRREKQLLVNQLPVYPPVPPDIKEPCGDQASYKAQTDILEYDQVGRVIKIVNEEFVVKYVYDPNGTVKATHTPTSVIRDPVKYSWYDSVGNLIEAKEEAPVGNIITGHPLGYFYGNFPVGSKLEKYKYDVNKNPLYTATIWPFQLPNNPVKLYGDEGGFAFEWSYTYNEYGFPIERIGSGGEKWIYHYR